MQPLFVVFQEIETVKLYDLRTIKQSLVKCAQILRRNEIKNALERFIQPDL